MSLNLAPRITKPPRLLVYGVAGVGKTTFAASAPAPVFVPTEDGLGVIDAPAFPLAATFEDVMNALQQLATEDHDFKTVVIDSVDWLEPMVWAETCRRNGWKTIEQPGYGKGPLAAVDVWRDYVRAINWLRDERAMTIIQIAHCQIKRFENPETDAYDRYQIKLQDRASGLIQEHADAVLFANYRISTVKSDAGFNQKIVRGVGGGDRLLYASERPAFLAKNRYAMPDQVEMTWEAVAPYFQPTEK